VGFLRESSSNIGVGGGILCGLADAVLEGPVSAELEEKLDGGDVTTSSGGDERGVLSAIADVDITASLNQSGDRRVSAVSGSQM